MRPEIKKDFSRFLNAAPQRLHMAAHSHHYWPDVTFDAHVQAWQDAAENVDAKWAYILGTVYNDVRRHIADILKLPDPETITFAPNTHEFLMRLLSCLPQDRPLEILTSDSEFYSFDRQMRRMAEEGLVNIKYIPAQPLDSFTTRFAKVAAEKDYDMIYVSKVFFNSGFDVTPLTEIARAVKSAETLIVIDGYHAFMATPVDFAALANRAFFIGGGYKYAMAGEGACFMHCPPGYGARPCNTGWFAALGTLHLPKTDTVQYGEDGSRFMGATADPTGLYRMRAVFDWMQKNGITVDEIHQHAHKMQKVFVEGLQELGKESLRPEDMVVGIEEPRRGNFLTFKTEKAGEICQMLSEKNVLTDHRGDCLRFGFAPYHDADDMAQLLKVIQKHVR